MVKEHQDSEIAIKEKVKIKKPSKYQVLLHNDDYTTMEFVIEILKFIFAKSHEEAMEIMLKVHQEGIGKCGTYAKDVAETKCKEVIDLARKNQFPLMCTIEPEDKN